MLGSLCRDLRAFWEVAATLLIFVELFETLNAVGKCFGDGLEESFAICTSVQSTGVNTYRISKSFA